MASPKRDGSLSVAVAHGDAAVVEDLVREGADVSVRGLDGMTPLALASFWGYADIVELLLKFGADIDAANTGSGWTPLHCAAFQGQGPSIMRLMKHSPNLLVKDTRNRTAVDFASAHDGIWPFFAAAGCKRTPKSELVKMDIIQSSTYEESRQQVEGKMYELQMGDYDIKRDPNMDVAAITGDVLADSPDNNGYGGGAPALNVYNN